MKIIFVCTGNTCRSSMAEGLMKHYISLSNLKDEKTVVESAGLSVIPGDTANEKSIKVLKEEENIDISSHVARQLTYEMIEEADLILTMTRQHKNAIISAVNKAADKTFTLKEYAFGNDDDISDPYGRDYEVYKNCCAEIKECISKIIENLEDRKLKIVIGCDHGGYELKEKVKKYLLDNSYEVEDVGTYTTDSVDYPDYGQKAAKMVASGQMDKGIVICTTGIGISIAANKVKGIRCALCTNSLMAKMSRLHNDANMLSLGAGLTGQNLALDIVDTWLNTDFEGGRHQRRVNKIMDIENS